MARADLYLQRTGDISYLLLYTAIIFWVITVSTTRLENLPADSFFYARSLPVTYWTGVSLLLASGLLQAYFMRNGRLSMVFITIFILAFVLFLFGTPCFVYDTPGFGDTYSHMGRVMLIAKTGHVDYATDWYSFQYPGAFDFYAALHLVSGIDAFPIMRYYPIFSVFVLSLFVFVLARQMCRTNNRKVLLAPLAFLGFSWFQEYHVSRQSFGLILYFVWVFCLLELTLFRSSRKRLPWFFIFVISVTSCNISHPGTPIFLILNLVGLSLMSLLFRSDRGNFATSVKVILTLLAVVAFFAWSMYNARATYEGIVASVAYSIGNILSNPGNPLIRRYDPQPEYLVVNDIRMALGVLEVAFSLGFFLILWLMRTRRAEALVTISLLSSVFVFLPFTLFSGAGGWGSVVERPFLYGLIFFSLMGSLFLTIEKGGLGIRLLEILLVCAIIAGLLLLPVTRNSVDPVEQPPYSFLSKLSFVRDHVYESKPSIDIMEEIPGLIDSKEALGEKQMPLLMDPSLGVEYLTKYDLISFGSLGYNGFEIYNQKGKAYLQNEKAVLSKYDRIFDSGASRIYVK